MSSSRLAKLRTMSADELAQRVSYAAYTSFERARHRRGRLAPVDRLRSALVDEIRKRDDWQRVLAARRGSNRFLAWEDDTDGIRTAFQTRFAPELERSRAIASGVARHHVSFFGETFRLGPEINWHADPVSGVEWPRRYHRDVPVNGGNVGFGDVKYVWELNRHQFFVDLAKIAFLDRSRAHADAVHAMLRSWMAAAPYGTGVPWACALEPAFRAYSWLWSYHLVRAAGLLDDETHVLWLTGLYDHGRFLHRHLEHYSSPYNHLIGEAATLLALGLVLPEVNEAAAWVSRGRKVLESTVRSQFYADGGSVEQSTFYHHATLGFYLLSIVLGRRSGVEFSRDVHSAVERGIEFSIALMQPDRRLPRIGGADDGKPIRLEHMPFWDFRPYYAIGAVLFSRPDFKFAAERFWEDALWLLGVEGLAQFEAMHRTEPPRATAFSHSGYYVARSNWSEKGDYLCFDCGEQAAGLRRDDIPSAAHGHADCLSVVIALAGEEVVVDPGFFCYNGDPQWEVHFRKTPAHNTVTIDGKDQARHLSKMAWARTYAATPDGWSPNGELAWAQGHHDGYARGVDGCQHRRTAWLRPEGYAVVHDQLFAGGHHRAEATFQFAPGQVTLDGSSALFNGRFQLTWICSAPVRVRVEHGGSAPGDGWIATSLGVRCPAPRLVLEFAVPKGPVSLLTVIADTERAQVATPRTHRDSHLDPLEATVRRGDCVDELFAAIGGSVAVPGIDTDASLVVVCVRDGEVIKANHAGGSRFKMERMVVHQFATPQATRLVNH